MASDQVLPNSSVSSKKQQQLEAGKRRLEEFRKKKAAAKKAASSNSDHSANGGLHEKKPSVDTVQITDSASDLGAGSIVEENEKKTKDMHEAEPRPISVTHASPPSISSHNAHSANPGQTYSADGKVGDNDTPYGSVNAPEEQWKNVRLGSSAGYGVDTEQNRPFHPPDKGIDSNSNHFSNVKSENPLSNNVDLHLKGFTSASPFTTQVSFRNSSPESSHNASLAMSSGHSDQLADGPKYKDSSFEDGKSQNGVFENGYTLVPARGDAKHSPLPSESTSSLWSPESRSTNFRFDAAPSMNQASTAVTGRRSRPSFLDSIGMSRNSSSSLLQAEKDKPNPLSSKVYPVDAPAPSSDSQNVMNSSVANVSDLFRQAHELDVERRSNSYSTKQNEDFAALEQHIEDLTQEKFSLQRALEASRVLAESLATENSALTESYNQQGGIIHQLKCDMEKLQEEIKAQLGELKALRVEYGNAHAECSAADERAKLLASEVIGLEEKALRLRSNELKLERQLENLQDEMSSQKKRISSLEKERQDLQFTIDALQEEKKLLQSKLRKAPPSVKPVDIKKTPINTKEASTSTQDLVNEDEEDTTPATYLEMPGSEASSSSVHPQSRHLDIEASSLSIPPDQMRTIENINTLISELALEKEELRQALSAESSQASKLKGLNKELSQKLEIQTQRLELLTSQSMASEHTPARKPAPRTVVENTPYADEGDEVVERVLGWIMKLFPGGPSRRQTKHL